MLSCADVPDTDTCHCTTLKVKSAQKINKIKSVNTIIDLIRKSLLTGKLSKLMVTDTNPIFFNLKPLILSLVIVFFKEEGTMVYF